MPMQIYATQCGAYKVSDLVFVQISGEEARPPGFEIICRVVLDMCKIWDNGMVYVFYSSDGYCFQTLICLLLELFSKSMILCVML